jgi:hypothetical protein
VSIFRSVLAVVPFGIGIPVLFAGAAQRVSKRSWYAAAALWGVLSWGGIAVAIVSPDDSAGSTIGGFMILLAWFGGGDRRLRLAREHGDHAAPRRRPRRGLRPYVVFLPR